MGATGNEDSALSVHADPLGGRHPGFCSEHSHVRSWVQSPGVVPRSNARSVHQQCQLLFCWGFFHREGRMLKLKLGIKASHGLITGHTPYLWKTSLCGTN